MKLQTKENIALIQNYLKSFGYLKGDFEAGSMDEKTAKALKIFKLAYALEDVNSKSLDGINEDLLKFIKKQRCGLPDDFPLHEGKDMFSSKFVTVGCSYFAVLRRIKYQVLNTTPDLSITACKQAIANAFNTWSQVIPIDFVESSSSPTFKIGFHTGNHGDGAPFDGANGVLAHAFYPPPCGGVHAGKMHFDEAELWRVNGSNFDLESVALHEIGHLLGLKHSNVPNSIMYAYYGGVRRTLTSDDIAGIQSLYGRRSASRLALTCHLQNTGDVNGIENEFIGTRGQSRRLEGFSITQSTPIPNLSLEYMAHLQNIGDTPWTPQGTFVGTKGQSRRLEGFAIRLVGPQASNFRVIYMAHIQGLGDTGLFSNGQFCGTKGQSRRVEGMLVRIEAV
jgi:Matrixin/Clostridial hydrophobic W